MVNHHIGRLAGTHGAGRTLSETMKTHDFDWTFLKNIMKHIMFTSWALYIFVLNLNYVESAWPCWHGKATL